MCHGYQLFTHSTVTISPVNAQDNKDIQGFICHSGGLFLYISTLKFAHEEMH